jgi:hypothetical protein
VVHITFCSIFTKGDQNSTHKVLGASVFPFAFMKHLVVSGERCDGVVPASGERS